MSSSRTFVLLLIVLFVSSALLTAEVTDDDRLLLARADIAANLPPTFRASLRVSQASHDRMARLEVWRNTEREYLIRFLDPHERGKFLLQHGADLWFISPGSKRPVSLHRAYRLWGTASIDELMGPAIGDNFVLTAAEHRATDSGELVELDLEAARPDAPYARLRLVVRSDLQRPLRIEYRLASGTTARVVEFLSWDESDRPRPHWLVIKDVLRGGPPVRVEIVEVEAVSPPEGLFSLEDGSARAALDLPQREK